MASLFCKLYIINVLKQILCTMLVDENSSTMHMKTLYIVTKLVYYITNFFFINMIKNFIC